MPNDLGLIRIERGQYDHGHQSVGRLGNRLWWGQTGPYCTQLVRSQSPKPQLTSSCTPLLLYPLSPTSMLQGRDFPSRPKPPCFTLAPCADHGGSRTGHCPGTRVSRVTGRRSGLESNVTGPCHRLLVDNTCTVRHKKQEDFRMMYTYSR